MHPQVVSRVVDPGPQRGPLREQRLVGDLHGRPARDGVAIERQQPVPSERVEQSPDPARLVELLHLHDEGPASRSDGGAVVVDADQSEEHLPCGLRHLRTEPGEQRVGPSGQGPRHPSAGAVGREGDRTADACFEQFGQRVLQQGQGADSVDGLAHHLGHDQRIHVDAGLAGRAGDGGLQLVDRHRGDHFGAVAQQFAEGAVPQRPVVEVGAQRDDDPDARARCGDEVDQLVDEPGRGVVVDLGEQLLELVDDDQQLVVVGGQDAIDGAAHTARSEHQIEQRGRWVRRDAEQGRLELLEGVRGWCHVDPEPVRRHRQRPVRQGGQQPGSHGARLAASARPDDGHEPSPDAGCAEAG